MNTHGLGFQSLTDEVGPIDLPVTGELPGWLDGALLRTGPALFEVGQSRYRHWFDGLAMLYRFGFQDGRVRYTNRFLHSRGYEAAQAQGRIAYSEFDTPADIDILGRLATLVRGPQPSHNANVNMISRADGVFALTETPTPMAIDPETLKTIGPRPFQDELNGQVTTAHPHTDAKRKVQINYLLEFGRNSAIHVFEHPLNGRARRFVASVPVDRPAYMHSFGMTDRHVVLVEPPFRVHPLRLRFSLKPFIANYRWHAGEGTRFRLLDRAEATISTVEGEPCFVFHQVNAFDDGDATAGAGRRYRSLWVASTRGRDSGFFDRIVRVDVENGSGAAVWEQPNLLCRRAGLRSASGQSRRDRRNRALPNPRRRDPTVRPVGTGRQEPGGGGAGEPASPRPIPLPWTTRKRRGISRHGDLKSQADGRVCSVNGSDSPGCPRSPGVHHRRTPATPTPRPRSRSGSRGSHR